MLDRSEQPGLDVETDKRNRNQPEMERNGSKPAACRVAVAAGVVFRPPRIVDDDTRRVLGRRLGGGRAHHRPIARLHLHAAGVRPAHQYLVQARQAGSYFQEVAAGHCRSRAVASTLAGKGEEKLNRVRFRAMFEHGSGSGSTQAFDPLRRWRNSWSW